MEPTRSALRLVHRRGALSCLEEPRVNPLMLAREVGTALVASAALVVGVAAQTDLDSFIAKALERREVNRRTLNDYILSEVETFEALAPGRVPLYRFKREYAWYVREGIHVRSPVRFDGVTIAEERRRRYEADWFRRERDRQKTEAEKKAKAETATGEQAPVPGGAGLDQGPLVGQVLEPRFVSEAYFLDFKFEPGNYYLVGREQLEGHEVVRVEYYPTRMFSDEEEKKADVPQSEQRPQARRRPPTDRERELEAEIERKMNKTSLVTLWIDPAAHQIVKYTFDNVWLDFLPARWLVRVDDLRATMTMGQPFQGVWLPTAITIHAGVTLASGAYEASYARAFSDYREADVTSKIRVKDPEAR